MKHPAAIMRGTPTGEFYFAITNYKGKTVLTSVKYETEKEVKDAITALAPMVKTATKNVIDQLPSTIAHK